MKTIKTTTIASTFRTVLPPPRSLTSRHYATRKPARHMNTNPREKMPAGETVSKTHEHATRLMKEKGAPLIPVARTRTWVAELASVLTLKISSMRSWTKRPRWKARRSSIPPTAMALHRQALEAFAAGDREALRRICVANYADRLIASLDRRPKREGVRFSFEPGSWSLWYPRTKSHFVVALDSSAMLEQAVVAMSSTQKMSKYVLSTGQAIPGSLKLQHKVEHVVLTRLVDLVTYEVKPWKLWGIVSPTTLEEYLKDRIAGEKDLIHRAGWKT
ncbi:hypothetical protein L249_8216 [Ophiocordyceps polyrhachis-furcata BCC 54312]|uniref:Tim44-like domain-containing protein n=1 Tax=Ophiocordyceps polyrhachis-furcata BCC 54312 TaxID=1330021 RepID=A0A367LH01_9HYPO|nr:hypothetical protein L249_8216 [Ophiocordyceps polyrhachis-furcata BCC 54312]